MRNLDTSWPASCAWVCLCKSPAPLAAPIALMMSVGLWPFTAISQAIPLPRQNPRSVSQDAEIICSENQSVPQIIVRGPQPANPFAFSSHRHSAEHNLGPLSVKRATRPVDSYKAEHIELPPPILVRFDQVGRSSCSFALSRLAAHKSWDALSFHTLKIGGKTSSTLMIELIDESAGQARPGVVVGRMASDIAVTIPLASSRNTLISGDSFR